MRRNCAKIGRIVAVLLLVFGLLLPAVNGAETTYPAYAASSDWYLGAHATTASGGTLDGAAGTTAGWLVRSMRLRLNPGTYTLQSIRCGIVYAATANCDGVRFGILGGNTTAASLVTLSNGLTYVDVTADKENTNSSRTLIGDLGDVTVTLEADTTYWFVVMLHKVEGATATYPGTRQMNDGQWVLGDMWKGQVNGAIAAMPTDTTSLSYVAAGNEAGEQTRMCLEFTTANRILYSIDSAAYAGTEIQMIIPRAKSTTPDYWIMLKSADVADGQALSVALESDTNADKTLLTTLVQDFNDPEQMTFGAASVALAADEDGDTFDHGINVRGDGKMDLFYKNTQTGQGALGDADFCTISHACAAGTPTRGAEYTIAKPWSLKFSGTATVAKVQIGWDPLLMLGDSQSIDNAARLGGNLPTAFTYDRMQWNEGLSGGGVTFNTDTQTSLLQRYINDTPGLGDLCEMQGMVVVWAGAGVNDISQYVGTDATKRNPTVANILRVASTIAWKASDRGNAVLIIGLPPYSDPVNAGTEEAKAIQHQLNTGLEGIACGVRGAYVNPWYALVSGSQAADIPTANPTYIEDGLHYLAPGASLVSAKAASAVEQGIVGGWWANPARREARSRGLLFPR